MKFIPILFSTPMVQAILDGRKTMTRRTIKFPKGWVAEDNAWDWAALREYYPKWGCPYGQIGDVLWVRETFRGIEQDFGSPRYEYKATEKINLIDKWKPSLFMPKSACRIFLEITNVRVERLQDISEEDSMAEGVIDYEDGTFKNYFKQKGFKDEDGVECLSAKASFLSLWCSINGIDSWESNPFVWVVEFKRIDKPVNFK